MNRFIQEIKDLFENIRYAWHERKTAYIDTGPINEQYKKYRKLYKEKMVSASEHLKNNDSRGYDREKFLADDYNDTANLWDREDRMAKSINDNRYDIKGSLNSMITAYITSIGAVGGAALTMPSIYIDNSNILSEIAFFGFIILSGLTFSAGVLNQRRLNRLVKEQMAYVKEFDETKDSIEEKRSYEL